MHCCSSASDLICNFKLNALFLFYSILFSSIRLSHFFLLSQSWRKCKHNKGFRTNKSRRKKRNKNNEIIRKHLLMTKLTAIICRWLLPICCGDPLSWCYAGIDRRFEQRERERGRNLTSCE